ncbi:MAG: hypothetical protein AXW16_05155 [Cycloclasticus sp. Phe_18]|nr:MAG: hypothetical protein AXW16_05155 [Cycloclasticus sp. Phe_18]
MLTGEGSGEVAFFGTTLGGTGFAIFLTGVGLVLIFLGDGAWVTIFFFLIFFGLGLGVWIGAGGMMGAGWVIEIWIDFAGMLSMSGVEKTPIL